MVPGLQVRALSIQAAQIQTVVSLRARQSTILLQNLQAPRVGTQPTSKLSRDVSKWTNADHARVRTVYDSIHKHFHGGKTRQDTVVLFLKSSMYGPHRIQQRDPDRREPGRRSPAARHLLPAHTGGPARPTEAYRVLAGLWHAAP